MPYGDVLPNGAIAMTPDPMDCGCPPPPAYVYPWGPPPPPPYPYPVLPYPPPASTSTEAQIAKLARKFAVIRKMIDDLTTKNKSILISIGNAQYNFGTYLDTAQEVTAYGTDVLTNLLEVELEAIKSRLIELTNELDAVDENTEAIEGTVQGTE